MPHVAFVSLVGTRVCEDRVRQLGMTLPGLRRRGAAVGQLPSLGLLTVAALTPPRWTCSYHECDADVEAVAEEVLSERPILVAISALTASILDAYRLCTALRAAGVQTVIGGLHATACPQEVAAHADAAVVGDGEPVWSDVLADAERRCLRRVYRAARPFELTDTPIPRFDLLGRNSRSRFTLQTQRGCPFACDFCGASRLLGGFREKPIDKIAGELGALCEIHPQPVIELADDNTFAGRRDVGELLDLLAAHDVRWFTESDWRIGERPDVLRELAAAGCVQVLVGIESLVCDHRGMGAKQASLDRVMDAIGAIQDAGVAVNGCFIVGCDGETRASIDRLAAFILESPLADVQITLQTPFPGTPLRRRLERERRLLADRDWSLYTLFDVTYQPDGMTVAALESAFVDLLRTVYAQGPTARRSDIRRSVWRNNPSLHRCESALSFDI